MNEFFIKYLEYVFMFMCGSMLGWVLELLFRNIVMGERKKKWVNPGFLIGPCVPLYGFGLCALYAMASIKIPIENEIAANAVLFILMAAAMTLIEYIAGLIFIKGMKIKLWDYSDLWGNIDGIICPLFSFFWAVLSALYYFLIHPVINEWLYWFVNHIWYSYFVGIFTGIFLIDFAVSMNIMTKVREFAKEKEIVVKIEDFKKRVLEFKVSHNLKSRFMFTMQNAGALRERLRDYYDDFVNEINNEKNKIKKRNK
ncbi:MAG: putative ABC transporter permease [Firmicutes bacterium]|nr:putative ABC transporter permease [Bacillota bacterium]